MLSTYFLSSLEKALNRYLTLDPESAKRLAALEGKTITIELMPLQKCFQLQIIDHKLRLHKEAPFSAEMKIKGTPLNMLSLAFSRDKKRQFFLANLVIEGDTELGQQFMAVFEQLDIDWEEYLSHGVGDVAAHEFFRFTKNMLAWGNEARERLLRNTDEYIHEEKAWLPPAEAVGDFLREVDELRLDADRLEARVRELL